MSNLPIPSPTQVAHRSRLNRPAPPRHYRADRDPLNVGEFRVTVESKSGTRILTSSVLFEPCLVASKRFLADYTGDDGYRISYSTHTRTWRVDAILRADGKPRVRPLFVAYVRIVSISPDQIRRERGL